MDNIFIKTYHLVRDFFLLPKVLVDKIKNAKNPQPDKTDELMQELSKNTKGLSMKELSLEKRKNEELGMKTTTWNYTIKNNYGQIVKGIFDAYTKEEVAAFLTNEGYQVIEVTPRKVYEMDLVPVKLNAGELSFMLTQLSTYIRAGIPLVDSVRILAKQTPNPSKRKIYERLVYDLTMGENFSTALNMQDKIFPKLLINMVRTAEMTGDLPGTLDEMAEYFTSIEETRKQMISALTYPAVIFVVAICVVSFILIWVVPGFVELYSSNSATLPAITIFTMNASNFLQDHYIVICIVLLAMILSYSYAFKNIKSFRKMMQTFYMKLPVFGNIIIYNEVTMFTKTFASLLTHSVRITDSMDILSKITNNEVYKEIIANTLNTLSKGGKISESFRGQWAFPVVAYEMLVTGESTGQLGLMMEKVSEHFQNLHRNSVNALKSLIEPITICLLAVVVGFILISIVVPMFDMFSIVG